MRASLRSASFAAALAAAALLAPAGASADFGLLPGPEGFTVSMPSGGSAAQEAGTHPDELAVHIGLNANGQYTGGDLRDLELELPAGMLANPESLEQCAQAQFFTPRVSPYETSLSGESCPDNTQVGTIALHTGPGGGVVRHFGLFDLTAPYGSAAALGASPFGIPLILDGELSPGATLSFDLENLSQALDVHALDITIWGTPWDYHHDVQRGNCLNEADPAAYHGEPSYFEPPAKPGDPPVFHPGTCYVPLSGVSVAFPIGQFSHSYLTLPPTCGGEMPFAAQARSWQGGEAGASVLASEGPDPVVLSNCLEVLTKAKMQLRTDKAATATGIVFGLEVNDGGGFTNPAGHVRSPVQRTRATLPEGLTINPSLGAGLGVCTEADFARESASSAPGQGCPLSSKIGEVSATGLLGLAEEIHGSVYLAKPYANPTNNLLSLYITLASQRRGFFFSSYGTVEPDLGTGRLAVSFENLPPLHYDRFTLSLRQGERAPMISPPACGLHAVTLISSPYDDPSLALVDSAPFAIEAGEGGGPCPSGATPPFAPALQAGSENPNAGSYTPFKLRMTRTDAEQEITSYSATFPPGLLGKIAGIPYCPDSAIEAAKLRSGVEELDRPSCPASSSVGHTIAGYGVGSTLAYAPGGLYLSGPYHGAPLSITAIDSALVGPFDLGVVVVRSAIRIDPRTAQASIDSTGSDPIPHIIKGIPIHLRDIRVFVDRANFTVNPTNCDPLATASRLTGAGLAFGDPADDSTATTTDRYQLSNCSAYGLKPKLALALSGPTTRGRYPQLKATYLPRAGDANLKQATVALPRTLFLAQEHIDEICTLPRFKAKTCPAGSKLGTASASTPLMDEPLKGPVYARSNPGKLLPDIVAGLSGRGIEIEVLGHIGKASTGGLRASFDSLPDAPVTKFTMKLFGGKRGLLVNAGNLCAEAQYASARFIAHNNATEATRPRIGVNCKKKRKAGKQR